MSGATPYPRLAAVDVAPPKDTRDARSTDTVATLDVTDPRWVLALKTRDALQGPVLPPAQRERLLALGKRMGLTAFEANLVMAITQDQARRGGSLNRAVGSLAMVPQHRETQPHKLASVAVWVFALLAAEALALGLILFR